ncbi:MAG: N-6 DNA methylase [Thermomicrobiales bacterium]
MPENLFFNTMAPGIVLIINRSKRYPGEILLVNASKRFEKGRPKNHLTADGIESIARLYEEWVSEEGVSSIISTDEAASNDFEIFLIKPIRFK